jgi:hypothetical protein
VVGSTGVRTLKGELAPAYYVVVAAIVSLLTILTLQKTAGRSLPHGVSDEMFQSNADICRARRPPGSDLSYS